MTNRSPHLSAQPSASLVASLCYEMDQLRCRGAQVMADLGRCREERLLQRLKRELEQLQSRRQELQACASQLRRSVGLRDSLAVAFLEELTRRPLPC
ncbi:hypothetical protein KBY57_06075 [Cyanobium sp. Aljojuca 7D2]|uniref:hypothetical protein n=1 Tax=Cyanobium sp. Aljojuca 7D2 TaxID=2823698 RepID=UPI0020CE13ED|nr:hypothetical protein [Cyanobium sp. Aljojuca 7D2]MCP9890624.1 hypothetical protein [Cyanobium sp. Aljojuca 7D2]